MDHAEILTGLIIIPPLALLFAFTDKKIKFMQKSAFYRPKFFENLLLNASFLTMFYIVFCLFI